MTRTSDQRDRFGDVSVIVNNRSAKAVQLSRDGDLQWIPRTLLSFSSENDIDGAAIGEELDVEIRDWKIKELGWK